MIPKVDLGLGEMGFIFFDLLFFSKLTHRRGVRNSTICLFIVVFFCRVNRFHTYQNENLFKRYFSVLNFLSVDRRRSIIVKLKARIK